LNYKFILSLHFLLLILVPATEGEAKTYPSFGPLTIRNQNPIYLQTLNLTPTDAHILPRGTLELRIDFGYSNIFEQGSSMTNSFMEDMELSRIALHANYPVKDDLQVGIEVPFIQMWHGFLDGFIQDFHNIFGFPNAGRENWPNNKFHFYFNSNGQTIYSVNSQTPNLGDISIRLKHQVREERWANPAIAWFFDFKFPTGRKSRGLGNGGGDYGFGAIVEKSYKRLHGYLNTAFYVSSRQDQLEPYMNNTFFSYSAAAEFTVISTMSVIMQVNGQTPLLAHTGMGQWDGIPLDLIVGFRGQENGLLFGKDLIWQVGFSEDVTCGGPSIDFTAFLSIGVRFDVKGPRSMRRQKGNIILQRPELSF